MKEKPKRKALTRAAIGKFMGYEALAHAVALLSKTPGVTVTLAYRDNGHMVERPQKPPRSWPKGMTPGPLRLPAREVVVRKAGRVVLHLAEVQDVNRGPTWVACR